MKQRTLNALLAGLAGIALGGGIIGSIWTFDWRYAGSGLILALLVALVAGTLLPMNRNH